MLSRVAFWGVITALHSTDRHSIYYSPQPAAPH
jgi:hypothetical protein